MFYPSQQENLKAFDVMIILASHLTCFICLLIFSKVPAYVLSTPRGRSISCFLAQMGAEKHTVSPESAPLGAPLQPAATPLCTEVEWCSAATAPRLEMLQHVVPVCGSACERLRVWTRSLRCLIPACLKGQDVDDKRSLHCSDKHQILCWSVMIRCVCARVCVWTCLNVKRPWKDWVSQEKLMRREWGRIQAVGRLYTLRKQNGQERGQWQTRGRTEGCSILVNLKT